jgi:hypothetical protein
LCECLCSHHWTDDDDDTPQSIHQVFQSIVKTEGMGGLFKGIIPRIGLGIWQTLFMVTGAKLLKQYL